MEIENPTQDKKNFMWYLRRGVILTKDNLAKQNWQRNQQCCFRHENETIQHLFFNCRFTQMVWASVYAAWGIPKPRNVSNIFGSWLNGLQKKLNNKFLWARHPYVGLFGSEKTQ